MDGSALNCSISKTSCGSLRPRYSSFEYRPVPLDRKSGIPRLVEMPAPVRQMMFLLRLIRSAASWTVLRWGSLARLLSSRAMAAERRLK